VIDISVTISAFIWEVNIALPVLPIPIGFWIVTIGFELYPYPPFIISIDCMVPEIETIAVPIDWNNSLLSKISIEFTIFSDIFSFLASNIVFTLSTNIWVEPTPTEFIILHEGKILDS
jgi:hypothetical protein